MSPVELLYSLAVDNELVVPHYFQSTFITPPLAIDI